MLAKIENIQQLESAIAWMRTGQVALQLGLALTLVLLALCVASIFLKDERMAHAARRGQYAMFLLTAFCCGLLYLGLFDGYYFVSYIGRVTENNETTGFKIAALWASQQGSLLFWCFILTLFGGAFALSQRHNRTDRRLPYVLAVLAVVQFFFFYIMVNPLDAAAAQRSSPFSLSYYWMIAQVMDESGRVVSMGGMQTISAVLQPDSGFRTSQDGWELLRACFDSKKGDMTLAQLYDVVINKPSTLPAPVQAALLDAVSDGDGMNPQLHNYWIAIHPPMLYLGFVGFTIPFAYAVGSLLSGEVSEGWLKPIRLWTMAAWGFLTVGIALGGLWAYEILGWGGYWAWDPVENASFIPWLTGTAFIHSVIVTERRGMLRMWSFALIIVTYCMTVVGTFLVRSGVINSVHAFGNTGDVDNWFYGFIAVVFIGSLLALIWRSPLLKSDRKLDSLISREGSFLFNNLAFVFIALVTLVCTFWPLITKFAYGGEGQELGQDVFVMINAPLFLLVLWLMGVGPALAWRRNNLRQLGRAMLPPTVAAVIVGVVNLIWLNAHDLFINTDLSESVARYAATVRLTMQVLLWPVCAFTLVCILMEFVSGARARSRATRENVFIALLRITLSNRRRYGGYIVHLGVLLIALGIYYSSFYENEGTVVTPPGGFAVLDDRLSGDRYLVYYESNERSEDWDFLRESFGRDPERAQTYENMLRYVRKHPDKSASEIITIVRRDSEAQFGGELPEFFLTSALPRMTAAVHWGVAQRDSKRVFESFDTRLSIFPYRAATQPEITGYLEAHDSVLELMHGDARGGDAFNDRSVGLTIARFYAGMIASDDTRGFVDEFKRLRNELANFDPDRLLELQPFDSFGTDVEGASRLRALCLTQMDAMLAAFESAAVEGIKLGASLPDVNRGLREQYAEFTAPQLASLIHFNTSDPAEVAAGRFEALSTLERLHEMLEDVTVKRRNALVETLAADMANPESSAKLEALRPLSLAGLVAARKQAQDPSAIDAEIALIREDAITVEPGMRIFYDKRSGAPKMAEPIKDPYYRRSLTRDLYFILQDAQPDGTATLRFFIKPQMTLGLVGLFVITIGTVLAFLPNFRRRRPEVA